MEVGSAHWPCVRRESGMPAQALKCRTTNLALPSPRRSCPVNNGSGSARVCCALSRVARRKPPGATHGTDIDAQGNGTIAEQWLYPLIRQSQPIADQQVEITFLDSGVEMFAFTF